MRKFMITTMSAMLMAAFIATPSFAQRGNGKGGGGGGGGGPRGGNPGASMNRGAAPSINAGAVPSMNRGAAPNVSRGVPNVSRPAPSINPAPSVSRAAPNVNRATLSAQGALPRAATPSANAQPRAPQMTNPLSNRQPQPIQPNTSLKPNLGNLPAGNTPRGNQPGAGAPGLNAPRLNNPAINAPAGDAVRDNANRGNNSPTFSNRANNNPGNPARDNVNRGANNIGNDLNRANNALPGLGNNANRALNDVNRALNQNLGGNRNPLDGRNNLLNNNVNIGRDGVNFNNNNRGNRNDWARANYRDYNRYGTYGRYNNWYRGPNYNNIGWYGGFLGLALGNGYGGGWGYPGYGYGYGYNPGWYGYGNGWGYGNLLYRSGYGSYYNPYYNNTYGGYNYAQPIVVTNYVAQSQPVTIPDFDQARQQFKNGRYQEALTAVDRAIAAQPNDPVLHEFRALVLFALGNYDQAAGTIHSVLAVGPGWDWTTMIGLYPSVDVYTKQIRALEAYTENNPQSAASRFYLAYLYQTSGQTEPAIRRLKEVVAINPKDQGAAGMLKLLEGNTAEASASTQPPAQPTPAPANEPNLDTRALVGNWQATRENGRFDLKLNEDQTFSWKFTEGQRSDEITGTYKSEGPVLLLATKDQGTMAGKVTVNSNAGQPNEFQFQMVGGSENDLGLKFVK